MNVNTFSKGTTKHPFRSPMISEKYRAKQNWNFPIQCVKGQHLLMLRDGACGEGGWMRCQVSRTVRDSMQHATDTPNRNTPQPQRTTFHSSISEKFWQARSPQKPRSSVSASCHLFPFCFKMHVQMRLSRPERNTLQGVYTVRQIPRETLKQKN